MTTIQTSANPFKAWYEKKHHKRMPIYLQSSLKKKLFQQFLNEQIRTEKNPAQKEFMQLELSLSKS